MKGWQKVALALGIPFIAAGLFGGAIYFNQGSVEGDNPQPQQPETGPSEDEVDGPWESRAVKKNINLEDKSSQDVTSATIHVFSEKPTDNDGNVVWDNERAIEPYFGTSQEKDQVSVSSATTTVQYEPGTYYIAVESSDRYTTFGSVTIPDGSSYDVALSEYNQAPEQTTVTVADRYAPTLEQMDLGINSNTSSIEEHTADQTVKPTDSTEYRVWKAVVHTGSEDPTTDSDSDGNYDEGIRKVAVEFSGAGQSTSTSETVFNPNNGVDKLGSNDKAEITAVDDLVATSDQPLTVEATVVTFSTSTSGATDGDETLTDGENPVDIQLFDDSGAGTSAVGVVG
ncbi:hypothetical protein ACM16X_02750 [Haloarcula japonica]|uniref:hypothetical protein n=1 Tax=Haloarcula japonica TaxID=29282 RepID=UPI0039F6CBDE